MNKIQEFIKLNEKIQYRIVNNNKKARSFGTKHKLHQSEIHFIDAIGIEGNLNVTQVAEKLGVTKGAITQIANKLQKKDLIKKYKNEDNKKEIYIKLTKSGKIAYQKHLDFHAEMYKKMISYLNNLKESELNVLLDFTRMLESIVPDNNMK